MMSLAYSQDPSVNLGFLNLSLLMAEERET